MVVRKVVHVAENGSADLHLCYTGLLRTIGKRARAAAAHDRDSVAGGGASPCTCGEGGDGVADRSLLLDPIGNGRRVTLPSRHSDEAKTRAARDLMRERDHRRAWLHASAIHADVDLDRDVQALPRISESGVQLDQVL